MNQVSGEVLLVELVEVKISQVVVGDLLGKHVIDGDQDFVGDRDHGPLVAAPRLETKKFVSQVIAWQTDPSDVHDPRGAGQLHEHDSSASLKDAKNEATKPR